jgi:hypothetical protein
MNGHPTDEDDSARERALAVYLRDHFAGSTAGLALARRSRDANAGTELGDVLVSIAAEIDEDRRALRSIMSRLDVEPSTMKSGIGAISEAAGRLKGNGRVFRRSPSSSLVELEGLAAGIATKRNLWLALRQADSARVAISVGELDALVERASSQLERVLDAHDTAARRAFGAATPAAGNPSAE